MVCYTFVGIPKVIVNDDIDMVDVVETMCNDELMFLVFGDTVVDETQIIVTKQFVMFSKLRGSMISFVTNFSFVGAQCGATFLNSRVARPGADIAAVSTSECAIRFSDERINVIHGLEQIFGVLFSECDLVNASRRRNRSLRSGSVVLTKTDLDFLEACNHCVVHGFGFY